MKSALVAVQTKILATTIALTNKLASVVVTSNRKSAVDRLTNLTVAVLQGIFIIVRDNFDVINITDTRTFSIGKGISDSAVLADNFDRTVAFDRTFSDSAALADNFTRTVAFDRTFSDSAVLADLSITEFSKSMEDSAALADASITEFSKSAYDSAVLADNFTRTVAFDRTFSDSISVTDDVDGAAFLEDDQVAQFFKNITDPAGLTDIIEFFITRVIALADASIIIDSTEVGYNQNLIDLTVLADTLISVYSKNLTDSAAIADVGQVFLLNYADASYFSEEYVGSVSTF